MSSCKARGHCLGITSTLMRLVDEVQIIQCSGSSFFPRYFSILYWLSSLRSLSSFQAWVVHFLVLVGWSDFRLPLYFPRRFVSSDNITCLSWPALVLDPITYFPLLILVCPRALWRPQARPTAQFPYPSHLSPQYIYYRICFGIFENLECDSYNYTILGKTKRELNK